MNTKLEFIAAHAAEHPVILMCGVLSVSTSWFHSWLAAAPKRAARQVARVELLPWNALTERGLPVVCLDARHANGVLKTRSRQGSTCAPRWPHSEYRNQLDNGNLL
ncbi:hypothetical protein [Mangrovicoccus sp. HB161399]|uniref:hypothetical protein n=1 Tax=Mangrovicoccus sp. HB161399 TaxID=2720392 RepID=UPI001556C9C2|nr:hypothetical protein [Mangrovicoccus sp. HB161399]